MAIASRRNGWCTRQTSLTSRKAAAETLMYPAIHPQGLAENQLAKKTARQIGIHAAIDPIRNRRNEPRDLTNVLCVGSASASNVGCIAAERRGFDAYGTTTTAAHFGHLNDRPPCSGLAFNVLPHSQRNTIILWPANSANVFNPMGRRISLPASVQLQRSECRGSRSRGAPDRGLQPCARRRSVHRKPLTGPAFWSPPGSSVVHPSWASSAWAPL